MNQQHDVAIVGMACIFPGAGNLETYWNNILHKVDAIKVMPENRIDRVFYDPASTDVDRVYCNRGGFIDEFVDFNPLEYGIVPKTVQGTEPDQLLSLKLAHEALEDAGMFSKKIPLQNSGIVIGRGNYGGVELIKLIESIYGGEQLVQNLRYVKPGLKEKDLLKAKKAFQGLRGNFRPENAMGTVPNMLASLIANKFDFEGPAYSVDAACASSLIAVDHAVKELKSLQCDTMIAGAIHISQNPVLWSVFCMLGAFSRNQVVRPFDKRADGVLAGEGGGFMVLRRLEDALKDGQKIYAVIKGVGISSDGASASLMSPSSKGQVKALKNAWKTSGLDPKDIGYVEAHGTGTVLGDKVELATLLAFFGPGKKMPGAWLGAVKSMIGHAMPAAGMAGLIKTAMALYKGKIPPTLHCDEPLEFMHQTRFNLATDTMEWEQTGLPRIAGVNAFGFGGINGHVVLEAFNAPEKSPVRKPKSHKDEVILMARPTAQALIHDLENGNYAMGNGRHRLALFNPTRERIQKAVRIIQKGKAWRNRLDIWYTPDPILHEKHHKIAFVFPGLDVQAMNGLAVGNLEQIAQMFDLPKPRYAHSKNGVKVHLGIDESCRIIDRALRKLDIVPDIICGHSMGEWNGCYAAGMTDMEAVRKLEGLAIEREDTRIQATILSVKANIHQIEKLLEGMKNIYVTADNCPQQVIICGTPEAIADFQEILAQEGILFVKIPYKTLYHTPLAEKYVNDLKSNLDNVANLQLPQIPIWSAITVAQYPKTIEEIKQLHIDFMTHPVRFRELIEALYDRGVRYFLQIGAGAAMSFVNDTLTGNDFATMASGSTKSSVLSQLKRVTASLFVEGRKVKLSLLDIKQPQRTQTQDFSLKLDLGFKSILLESVLPAANISLPQKAVSHALSIPPASIVDNLNENLEQIGKAQNELLAYLRTGEKASLPPSVTNVLTDIPNQPITPIRRDIQKKVKISLTTFPELKHHCPFEKRSITDDFSNEDEPIVPFTTYIDLFVSTLKEYCPTVSIHKVVQVKVYQFLWVNKTGAVEIIGKWLDEQTIQFEIDTYAKATIIVDSQDLTAYYPPLELMNPQKAPIKASEIYAEGYMFHGPRFQGIRDIVAYSEEGIEVKISGASGKGAMLDNMGQAISLLYHLTGRNIIAYPIGMKELTYFQDPLDTSGVFTCTCIYRHHDEQFLYADMEMKRDGKRWCYVKGWQNRRSEVDDSIFKIISRAEGRYLSKTWASGISLMPRRYKRLNTWFIILNQYLNASEIDVYNTLSPMRQRNWLLGRIAAKDAIRKAVENKLGMLSHPASFSVFNDATGKPFASSKIIDNIYVSISHKEAYAVAYASLEKPVGIDIEKIIEDEEKLAGMILDESEKQMLKDRTDKKEWLTRFWVSKEAYGKLIGKGLNGNPRQYKVSDIDGDKLTIENTEIHTMLLHNYIIGYTI